MRLGISSNLNQTEPAKWAKRLNELGLKSVVFPVDYRAGKETIDAYVKAAKEYDLTIAEVGIWRNMLAREEAISKEVWEYSIGQLELADYIKAKCCVNVAGSMGPAWDGGYRDNFSNEAWKLTVESTQKLLDTVKPKHTFYSLEPMPWMIPMDPDEYIKLLTLVNRSHFAVHLDPINWVTNPHKYYFFDQFIEDCIDLLGDQIKSCHIKDISLSDQLTFQLKEVACGEGGLPLKAYLDAINRLDSEMPVIIEHLHSEEEYLKGIEYIQSLSGC